MTKIEEARRAAGLSRPDVYRLLKIPVRTQEDWDSEKNKCPVWVETLVLEKLQALQK